MPFINPLTLEQREAFLRTPKLLKGTYWLWGGSVVYVYRVSKRGRVHMMTTDYQSFSVSDYESFMLKGPYLGVAFPIKMGDYCRFPGFDNYYKVLAITPDRCHILRIPRTIEEAVAPHYIGWSTFLSSYEKVDLPSEILYRADRWCDPMISPSRIPVLYRQVFPEEFVTPPSIPEDLPVPEPVFEPIRPTSWERLIPDVKGATHDDSTS